MPLRVASVSVGVSEAAAFQRAPFETGIQARNPSLKSFAQPVCLRFALKALAAQTFCSASGARQRMIFCQFGDAG